MIDVDYVRLMARYNTWQNRAVFAAAGGLDDAERQADRGLFFRSVQETLSHLLWADQLWLHRFAGTPLPHAPDIAGSAALWREWQDLLGERKRFDRVIEDWAAGLSHGQLAGDLTWYSGSAKRELTRLRAVLIMHFFNHQTHHRGQVHAALTGLGRDPGVTDLPFLPGLA